MEQILFDDLTYMPSMMSSFSNTYSRAFLIVITRKEKMQ